MTTWAYLRVSTDAQDVNNQRHGILEYANKIGLSNLEFVEDSVSGRVKWTDRRLGELIKNLNSSDTVIFAEVSRIARSTLQVLEVLQHCVTHNVSVHIAKQNMVIKDDMQSKIYAVVLGLAAEIEREFISLRTREALSKRKQDGLPLGRPRGPAPKLKLDDKEPLIKSYLAKGINKRSIAKLIDCAPSTLYDWLDRRGIKLAKQARYK